MFQLDIDPSAKLPVYRQIIDQTHFAINTGALAAGERLASLRDLSRRHKVAINTVVKAFKALEQRGLVRSGPRTGYHVVGPSAATAAPAAEAKPNASRYQARGVSATKQEVHGAIATLECTVVETFSAGDHDLFIGRVDTLANETRHPMPLLYYRRRYLRIERAATAEVEGKPEA